MHVFTCFTWHALEDNYCRPVGNFLSVDTDVHLAFLARNGDKAFKVIVHFKASLRLLVVESKVPCSNFCRLKSPRNLSRGRLETDGHFNFIVGKAT